MKVGLIVKTGATAVTLLAITVVVLLFRPDSFNSRLAAQNSKVLCSAVFVSGRNLDEAYQNSVGTKLSGDRFERFENGVRFRSLGATRTSIFTECQGCIALPEGVDAFAFQPTCPVGQPDTVPLPRNIDEALQQGIVDQFASTGAHVATLVIQHGAVIAEHYADGFDAASKFESWSMGKSLTAALIGRLIQQGRLTLHQKAPISEWAGDARADITIAHLLNMSSGLKFTRNIGTLRTILTGGGNHGWIYHGASDVFDYSIGAPAEFGPNEVTRYRNSDPLVLGAIIRRTVEAAGENYLEWPQSALFDKLGTNGFMLETDIHGNFILTGYDYGTADAWARLGLLFLQRGEWQGEQLIPEEFVNFVQTPATAPTFDFPFGSYGGQFWLDPYGDGEGGDGESGDDVQFPHDAYYMNGLGGQWVVIVPSRNAVIVRFGHTTTSWWQPVEELMKMIDETLAASDGVRGQSKVRSDG
ncbi:MAG: serine hydrolase [Pseudomonadota bacterium]